MRACLCALLLVIAPVFANERPVLLDLAHAADRNNGLWVSLDQILTDKTQGQFRFSMLPTVATTGGLLEFVIETPDGNMPEPTRIVLHYYGVERPIEQDVYQSGNQYFVYLPELRANDLVEFCIRFENFDFASSGVVALLTLDDGQKAAVWNGSKR